MQEKESSSKMSLSQKRRKQSGSQLSVRSDWSKDADMPDFSTEKTPPIKRKRSSSAFSSSVSVKSDRSKDGGFLNFSQEKTPSINRKRSASTSRSVSVSSDQSMNGGLPNLSEETLSSFKRFKHDSDFHAHRHCKNYTDNLMLIFKELESTVITFLKNELETFKKILLRENTEYTDFNENRKSIKEAALDLTLHFLREMKQDDTADALEDELVFIQQLKHNLKKKYQCVLEGIAKQGDSTLLNNIYTDLYITQGCSEQVNTEHEVRQIEVASRRSESEEIQVECKHLFETFDGEKEITTVLTKGVAGIGKSISVQKFVLDWAEGKENQDIGLIFPLPFREMNLMKNDKHSLMDLITQFFPETNGLKLTRLKVLFILDGLDECRFPLEFDGNEICRDVSSPVSLDVLLTNLIKGNLLPSALVWITSRPAAANKIPPDCIDRLTEIRGFSDAQKEEYFRKRFTDQNHASQIIDHVKKSKSLFIMCHIPVFCWISATVIGNILEERKSNDLTNNHDASEDTPKTLTQMYTHFLRFQIMQSRRKYDGKYLPNASWDKDTILSLGNLAFQHLQKNNLIFYDTDLEACGIDVDKAIRYSGMCTQIFKEETGIIVGTVYCFVHLSIQEFIAALYAHLFLDINRKNIFIQDSTEQENETEMIDLLKRAVDKALESDNGHLDLFLRFLLGLSLQSNSRFLGRLFTNQDNRDQIKKEIVKYIKLKFNANLSLERSINLFYCLNELNDQTLVKEIQSHLSRGSLSSAYLSPAQWSALAFVLLTSEEEMEEFELHKFQKSDECLIRLSAVIKISKKALLNDCNLTHQSCSALASVLGSDTNLKELNMNDNSLLDSGVKLLCTGLTNKKCQLKILRLSNCRITEGGYKALASALRSNPSHLIELDLTGNDPGPSGVMELTDILHDPHCQLKTLRFLSAAADKACQYLTQVVGENALLLKELNLSGSKLGDTGVKQLTALLQDKHCTLNTLILNRCGITEKQSLVLTSSLKSNPSHLKELDLSENQIQVNRLCDLLKDSLCKLKRVSLRHCDMTDEGCAALASALKTNPSHLKELNLSVNKLRDTGVKNLCDLLMKPQCKLENLHLCRCSISEQQIVILTSALKSNPSHLRELDLSENQITKTGVKRLCELLKDSKCKLERLRLRDCDLPHKGCFAVASALKTNPSHLRELNLSGNELRNRGMKSLRDLLMNPQCKLEKLHLFYCSISEKMCVTLASALKSNPSHLRELDLSENQIKNTGLNHLSKVLQEPCCKLEKLSLFDCGITDVSALTQTLTNINALQILKELDLRDNKVGNSMKQLADVIQDSNCKLRLTQ